jgi:hypothetical protein
MDIFNGNSGPYFPPQFRYVGYVLVITGIIILINRNLFGIGFLVIGPAFFLLKTGIRINFDDRAFQEYRGVLGLYFGRWEKLPEIEYVTVYQETESEEMNVQSISSANIDTHFNTDLIFAEPHRLKVISFPEKTAAMEAGKVLAEKLNARLLDYTSEEPVWMDNKTIAEINSQE